MTDRIEVPAADIELAAQMMQWGHNDDDGLLPSQIKEIKAHQQKLLGYLRSPAKTVDELDLRFILQIYDDAMQKAFDGRKFDNPCKPGTLASIAWEIGTKEGAAKREAGLTNSILRLDDEELPLGAIENGRTLASRLAVESEIEGISPLSRNGDWEEFVRCFEYLAEWAMHSSLPAKEAVTPAAKLLPAEPDEEMLIVGQEQILKGPRGAMEDCVEARAVWDAMYAVAPIATGVPEELRRAMSEIEDQAAPLGSPAHAIFTSMRTAVQSFFAPDATADRRVCVYDLTPAEHIESAVRKRLMEMGWKPPGHDDDARCKALASALELANSYRSCFQARDRAVIDAVIASEKLLDDLVKKGLA